MVILLLSVFLISPAIAGRKKNKNWVPFSNVQEGFREPWVLPAPTIQAFISSDLSWKNLESVESNIADFQSIIELNQNASEIWQEILNCTGNDQMAREVYLQFDQSVCQSETKIKIDLGILQGNIANMLESSFVVKPFSLNGKDFRGMSPMFNPLFVQLVLNYMATNVVEEKISSSLYNSFYLLSLVNFESCEQFGLWPMVNRSVLSAIGFIDNFRLYGVINNDHPYAIYSGLRANIRELCSETKGYSSLFSDGMDNGVFVNGNVEFAQELLRISNQY